MLGSAETPPSDPLRDAYDAHAPELFRALRRLGVPDSLVEDAVHDTFLVASRRQGEFEGRSSYRTWLYGIARRVARDYRRHALRRGTEQPDFDAVSGGTSPERRVESVRAAQRLDAALAQLSDNLREVFVLVEIEQLPVPEVASVVGAGLNTVYSRLRLAREKLTSLLPSASREEDHHG